MRYVTRTTDAPTARFRFFNTTVEQEIYAAIAEARTALGAPAGMTCREIEDKLRMLNQTASSALSNMCKLGYIHDSGYKRMQPTGRRQTVYVL